MKVYGLSLWSVTAQMDFNMSIRLACSMSSLSLSWSSSEVSQYKTSLYLIQEMCRQYIDMSVRLGVHELFSAYLRMLCN